MSRKAKYRFNYTNLLFSYRRRKDLIVKDYLIQQHNMTQVLVFCSSVHRTDAVVEKLKKHGIESAAIHSKKAKVQRQMLYKTLNWVS